MSGNHPLNFFLALEDSFTEGHFPSHGQRLGNFGYADSEAGTGEAMSHTRSHLSSPFDQDNQVFQTSDSFIHNELCSKDDLPQSSQRTPYDSENPLMYAGDEFAILISVTSVLLT
jgi:hypothetical protein